MPRTPVAPTTSTVEFFVLLRAICLFCALTMPSRLLLCEFCFFLKLGAKDKFPFTRHLLRHFMERRDRRVGRLDIQRRSDPETDAVSIWCWLHMISAARSPIITQGAIVLPVVTRGMTDPSAMRRFLTPYTLRSPSTTDISSRPILAVDV